LRDASTIRTVGIVVALAAEASALTSHVVYPDRITPLMNGTALSLGGMGPQGAQRAAHALADAGATALAAFGVAGALDAGLRSGALLCPVRILDAEGRLYTLDSAWRTRLLQRLAEAAMPMSTATQLLSLSVPLLTTAAKRAARDQYAAQAVDMESAAVAAVAAARGLPFIALRAIVDELHDTIPAALQAGIDTWGRPRPFNLIAVLGRRPALLADLPGLYWRMRQATRTLRAAARAASPGLGWNV
jgi:adenosylhomocysteine nucleosidase